MHPSPPKTAFKGTTPEVIDFYAAQKSIQIPGIPAFDPTRVVDGQRKITFLRPLLVSSAGRRFEVRTTVLGVYDKGRPGTVMESQIDLVDAGDGDAVYARVVGSAFYVAQGMWGGPLGPATETFPPPPRGPDLVLGHQVGRGAALAYRLNGDYNPLHATPEPGRKMGFGGAIVHGLYSWNAACHDLLKALGGSDPANIREYQARFASPVRPGDKLVTRVWRMGNDKDGFEEVRFETSVEGGKVCLSNGRALIKCVGAQPKGKL
jgi:peroxisomal enoyl-CoA hydratase 2